MEREVFLSLITVPKVGAKSAVQILSLDTPGNIVSYVLSKDIKAISKANGIGKKTAETIIVTLYDKFEKLALFIGDTEDYSYSELMAEESSSAATDAIEALVALGFDLTTAKKAVNSVKDDYMTSEEILALALGKMGI